MIKKMVPLLLVLQLITIMNLSANTPAKFDFSTWKVQLPEARENSNSVKEVHGPELATGYTSDYFYYNSQGSIVFYCPVGASSTANSNYSRSELRELIDGVNTNVNWSLNGTHILNTEEKVTQVPSNGRTVVSQIHGIYPDGSNGPVLVKVEYDGLQESVVVLLKTATYKNAADERFYLRNIKLDEVFNTTIKVVEGRVFVTVISGDKKLEASKDFYKLDPTWENYRFYFKVGNYVQDSIIDYEGEAATVVLNDFNTFHTDKIESVPPTSLHLIETLQIEKGNEFQNQGIFKPFDTTNTILN